MRCHSNFYLILNFLSILLITLFIKETRQDDTKFPSFENFVQKFNKTYSEQQYKIREQIYQQKIIYLATLEQQYIGANQFADWSDQQLNNLFAKKELSLSSKFDGIQKFQMKKSNFFKDLSQPLPSKFDWRQKIPTTPVKNQLQCGNCWAFSTVGVYQYDLMINKPQQYSSNIDLSEQFLTKCDLNNGHCIQGGWQEIAFQYIFQKGGLPTQNDYPFSPSQQSQDMCKTNKLVKNPNRTYQNYVFIQDQQKIKQLILKQPLTIGIWASDYNFMYYYPGNWLYNSKKTIKCSPMANWYTINHAVLLVGYTQTQWIIKNQWGSQWGLQGYAYISRNPKQNCNLAATVVLLNKPVQSCKLKNCYQCTQVKCVKCIYGYGLGWQTKQDFVNRNQTCMLCSKNIPNCVRCLNYYPMCYNCELGYSLYKGGCIISTINNCAKSNFQDKNKCDRCQFGYLLADENSSCIKSDQFHKINHCLQYNTYDCMQCEDGYVIDYEKTPYICKKNQCKSNCKTCEQFGYCLQCMQFYKLNQQNQCVSSCLISNCLNCTQNECFQCVEGYSLDQSTSKCVKSTILNCKSLYSQSINSYCKECIDGFTFNSLKTQCLQTCEVENCTFSNREDAKECFICKYGYFLQKDNYGWNKCTLCQKGKQSNCTSAVCQIQNCAECDSQNHCGFCKQGFQLDKKNVCKKTINTNLCPNSCSKCYSEPGCISCKDSFYLVDTSCIPCKQNCRSCSYNSQVYTCYQCYLRFSLKNNLCSKCNDQNCLFCFTIQNCQACRQGYYLQNQTCKKILTKYCTEFDKQTCTKCQMGFTLLSNFQCFRCKVGCQKCSNESLNSCLQCRGGTYLNITQCVNCPSTCSACTDNVTCLKCLPGHTLNSKSACLKNCQDKNCQTCQNDFLICQNCYQGFNLQNGQCVIDTSCNGTSTCQLCPQRNYLQTGKCLQCPNVKIPCTKCNPNDGFKCTECQIAYYLSKTASCQTCPKQCIQCRTSELCTVCADGYYLQIFDDNPIGQCIKCSQKCNTCVRSPSLCTSCTDGYELTPHKLCLSKSKLKISLKLGLDFKTYSQKINGIQVELIKLLEISDQQNFQIQSASEGSTVIKISSAIPPGTNLNQALINTQKILSKGGSIGGFSIEQSNIVSVGQILTLNNSSVQNSSNTGLIIGLVVGIVGGLILLSIITFLCYKYLKTKKQQSDQNSVEKKEVETKQSFDNNKNNGKVNESNKVLQADGIEPIFL